MTGTPTAAQVLAQGVRQLGEAGIPDPARDGRRLMALWIRYKRDPRGAAQELTAWLERLRAAPSS